MISQVIYIHTKYANRDMFYHIYTYKKEESMHLPSPQLSLTLLTGVLVRKNSSKVVDGSKPSLVSSYLLPLSAKTRPLLRPFPIFCSPISLFISVLHKLSVSLAKSGIVSQFSRLLPQFLVANVKGLKPTPVAI